MSTWFYYNEIGEKICVTGGQLKGLAKTGKITPETLVENSEGKSALAGKVKGLTFAEMSPLETVSSEPSPFTASMPTGENPFTAVMPLASDAGETNFWGNLVQKGIEFVQRANEKTEVSEGNEIVDTVFDVVDTVLDVFDLFDDSVE